MKKSILALGLSFVAFTMSAQLVSKKGEPILPQKGDWALGIEANPFLDYIGNFFGKSVSNSSPTFNFLGNQVIVGKYFVDSMVAYRAGVRIGFGTQTMDRVNVDQLPAAPVGTSFPFPAPPAQVENTWSQSNTNIGLTGGMEWRKGKTRLQGYYGGEVGIFFSNSVDKFSYGNALAGSTTPSAIVGVMPADDFGGSANNVTGGPVSDGGVGNARVTERKNGSTFAFGVRGFAGVEYFFLPKMSIGGEFGWGIGFASKGKSTTTYESLGSTTGAATGVGTTEIETPGGTQFLIDSDNRNTFFGSSGALRLTFHF